MRRINRERKRISDQDKKQMEERNALLRNVANRMQGLVAPSVRRVLWTFPVKFQQGFYYLKDIYLGGEPF
jgi:hypothetical protein